MYIFFSIPWLTSVYVTDTEGTKGEAIIICLKIYKDRIIYFGEKKKTYSHTCNK